MPVFNHASLYVFDLNKSVHFYQSIIGFEMVPEPFKDGRHAWFSIGAGITLHIIEGAATAKDYYRSNHLCFSVASIENFMNLLRQHNISWEDSKGNPMAITVRADDIQQIYFKDPDGYWIEINDDNKLC
ncbi:MAG: VOC family protein [Ferruginibacter sp.]